jgi:hypothetical protein
LTLNTYQGRLNDGGNAANRSYDLTFTLFAPSGGGSAIAGPVSKAKVLVTTGLFKTTLDPGAKFPGADRCLEIAVLTNHSRLMKFTAGARRGVADATARQDASSTRRKD